MKRFPPRRVAAIVTLGCALLPVAEARAFRAQDNGSAAAVLLSRARTLEQRGRLDLAKQDWSQVLSVDPNEAEALAGLVRAARAEGRTADAATYLDRLKAAHPNDPEIERLQSDARGRDTAAELSEAARLSHAGDFQAAMTIYRRVYGVTPPPGSPALTYYGTEAAIEEGRPQAIAGLRALADRFPEDTRYQIALGRLLLGSARTRAEGRTILERYPGNPEAVAALRGEAPGTFGSPKAGAAPERTTATAQTPARPPVKRSPEPPRTESTPQGFAAHTAAAQGTPAVHHLTFVGEEQAAFAALNEHRAAEAEQRFREILAKDPHDARALAGMGYLRVTTADFKAAVTFFEQAQENGDRSLALTRAMVNAQFELALQGAATDRAKGDLTDAEVRYRAVLQERPNDPGALEGLGGTLMQEGHPADAIPVFTHLTQVRPMDPGAWRGLVVAEAQTGKGAAALATDARVPADARSPLQQDAAYRQALASAHATQVARVALPPSIRAGANRPQPPLPAQTATVKVPPSRSQSLAPAPPPVLAAPQPAMAAEAAPSRPSVASPKLPASAGLNADGKASSRSSVTARTQAPAKALPNRSAPPLPAPVSSASIAPPAPIPPARAAEAESSAAMQGADLALLHGENAEAASLFRALVARMPQRAEVWRGLVFALHNGGREPEAASALAQIPSPVRSMLDRDASFQSAAGEVYLATEQPNEALRAFARAQEVFSGQRLPPPLDLVMQTARLLAARGDDDNLYRELMYLGERRDLSDGQRTEVQMIWTRWAVRRARALAADGDGRRAVTLLNATAEAFAGNGDVLRAVANGYAGVGKAKEAVALYKTQDMASLPQAEIETAVAAASAAHEFRTAEGWIHVGLARFGQDAEMLTTAAELEQARGHEKRAVELSQQAKALAPAQNPGQVLAAELKEATAGHGWAQARGATGQLGVLLSPAEAAGLASGPQAGRPYLPVAADRQASAETQRVPSDAPLLTGYDEPSS